MPHSYFGNIDMFCSVCGRKYLWNCGYSWSKSRACSRECNEEFNWRDTLSICGHEYYPRIFAELAHQITYAKKAGKSAAEISFTVEEVKRWIPEMDMEIDQNWIRETIGFLYPKIKV